MTGKGELVNCWRMYYEAPTAGDKAALKTAIGRLIDDASGSIGIQVLLGATSPDLVKEFTKEVLAEVKKQSESNGKS